MLQSIVEYFERRIGARAEPDHDAAVRSATAALLAEMVRIDREVTPEEQAIAERAIRERFGLPPEEAAELLRLAAEEVQQASDYYQFTSLINRHFSQADKELILETLWEVAYADAEISAHERHLLRKVAGLLHVPDGAYVAARVRAQEKAARRSP